MAPQSTPHPLRDRSILVVEDDYFLAEELTRELTAIGALVVGPAPSIERALTLIAIQRDLDAAVLDVNLRGKMSYPVADALLARNVPVVFATGYSDVLLTSRYPKAIRLDKPVSFRDLGEALTVVLQRKASAVTL